MVSTEQPAAVEPPGVPGSRSGALEGRRRWWWVAAAVAVLLIIAAAAWLLLGSGSSAAAAEVHLESVSEGGPSPFTGPVGQDTPNVTAPNNAGGQYPGNTGGLYAQSPDKPVCDNQALMGQLLADPSKAAAWVQPLQVSPDSIRQFVSGLNPVTLRSDTAVTEYGYADGQYQPYPAVLQAGTAVFINSYGEPTVKCFNGDPLGRPTASNDSVSYVGAPWTQFQDVEVTRIVPTPAPIHVNVFVNPVTNIQVRVTNTVITNINNVVLRPNPAPRCGDDGQLLLRGVRAYDGKIVLSDGRLLAPDGTVTAPTLLYPPGSVTLPDGGIREPGGQVLNINGTERRTARIGEVIVHPDGTTTPPLPPGTVLHRNYDGSLIAVTPTSTQVFDSEGTPKSVNTRASGSQKAGEGSTAQKNGSLSTGSSSQTSSDGTQQGSIGTGSKGSGSDRDAQSTQPGQQQNTPSPQQQTGQGQGQGQGQQNPQQGPTFPETGFPQSPVVRNPQQGPTFPETGFPQSPAAPNPQQGPVLAGGQFQQAPTVQQPQQRVQVAPTQVRQSQVTRSAPQTQTIVVCTPQRQAEGLCVMPNSHSKSKRHHN